MKRIAGPLLKQKKSLKYFFASEEISEFSARLRLDKKQILKELTLS